MKVHFFERKLDENNISIEKLFGVVQRELVKKGVEVQIFKNTFPLKRMVSAMLYFRRNQGEINHITGDIHWACLLLDSRKTVLTIHDMVGLQNLHGWKRKLYFMLWLKLPLIKLKYITVISEKTKQELLYHLPLAHSKIRVIPNCLTTTVAPDIFDESNEIPKVLIVGTRTNKNLERIIVAMEGLKIKVSIVGMLFEKQLHLLHEKSIDFQSFKNISDEELENLYDTNDILCFPSLYEGFGLPILEAQARNCAVITSAISPLQEVAGDGAILVNPEEAHEIRNALEILINDTEFRKKVILKGKANVKKYHPEEIAQQYLALYNLIKNKL